MKVVITSQEKEMNSHVDARFGRAAYFALYDTETGQVDWLQNQVGTQQHGAGTGAVNRLANLGVEKIFACVFGAKVKPLLDELGIQMIVVQEGETVGHIIEMLQDRKK
ncbi:MAG TPA: NifB/NifX family molybdenum-iron cluster-binding protein [Bacteroidaceae bacterium]|nr:NifB/NifX family molybdenum-iron cluster-binding protein [Bacteroidaceae bacterium]